VTAYDRRDGPWLLGRTTTRRAFRKSMGGNGPARHPTYHEGRVYSLGAQGEFVCLDAARAG